MHWTTTTAKARAAPQVQGLHLELLPAQFDPMRVLSLLSGEVISLVCPKLYYPVRGDLGTLRFLGWEPDKELLSHAASAPTVEAGLSGDPHTLSQSHR